MSNTTEKQVFVDKNLQIEKDNLYKIVEKFFSKSRSNDYIPTLNEMAVSYLESNKGNLSFELANYFEIVNLILAIENCILNSKEMS